MQVNPKVTVLMPVYNSGQYLKEAIESILSQTFEEFEFIIINDGSTDFSESIILSYKDPRILYVKNDENIGLPDTLNRGISLANGEYIARMDADDISLPERLEKQLNFMEAHPKVAVCGTAYQYFGDSITVQTLPSDHKQVLSHLSFTSPIGHPTSMIRKKILDKNNLRYQNHDGYAADYALWLRIIRFDFITSLPEVLLLYRWHKTNMSKYDPTRDHSRGRVRSLWYEYVIGNPPDKRLVDYLEGKPISLESFRLVRQALLSVLNKRNDAFLDKEYFAKFNISEYEVELITQHPLPGILIALTDRNIHKWSPITRIGLIFCLIRSIRSRLFSTGKNLEG